MDQTVTTWCAILTDLQEGARKVHVLPPQKYIWSLTDQLQRCKREFCIYRVVDKVSQSLNN